MGKTGNINRMSTLISLVRNLKTAIHHLRIGMRLSYKLPCFLRHPVNLQESKANLKDRFRRREATFLALIRKVIYERPESPYNKLLNLAGCEYGDIEKLVNKETIEGALMILLRHGVYLTTDEFKGRKPVVRGSFKMEIDPALFRNPLSASHLIVQTSGSRGRRIIVPVDLAKVRDDASVYHLALRAWGDSGNSTAICMGPGGADLRIMLILCLTGNTPDQWFLRGKGGVSWRYRTKLMCLGSLIGGVRIPRPTYFSHIETLPIANWMAETLQAGRTPYLLGLVSPLLRVCQTAKDAGIDLRGAKFIMAGEPITEARKVLVESIGAKAIPFYASAETSVIGFGCAEPEVADDMHLLHDLHALIQSESKDQNVPRDGLFITTLQTKAPIILLNVSMGDQAVIKKRECGCPMQGFGWDTHLHTIRSYEKLTAGGQTLFDTNVIRILEEILPTKFGGGLADYQLIEDGTEVHPRVVLLVNPRIGPVDTDSITEAFLKGIRRESDEVWRTPGFFHVERREPIPTASGKVLHLHVERSVRS